MITKETQAGVEVFVLSPETEKCSKCMFHYASNECNKAQCLSRERSDKRNVYFVPITDVKTAIAYAVQQAP